MCALDQTVPGMLGGSVHVQSVAEGLAALGHEVHVAVQPGGAWPAGRVHWHAMAPAVRPRRAALDAPGRLRRWRGTCRADIVIERYYNFGGEGVLAAPTRACRPCSKSTRR